MTLNERIVAIARRIADTHRRRAAVIANDIIEAKQYAECMDDSYRVETLADLWERVPVKMN